MSVIKLINTSSTFFRGQCTGTAYITSENRCPNDTGYNWKYFPMDKNGFTDAPRGLTIKCIEYTRVMSGSTCERVSSKSECEKAARQLGLAVTVASEESASDWPPHCYFHNGWQLWFNTDGNAVSHCDSREMVCICKETSGKARSNYMSHEGSRTK